MSAKKKAAGNATPTAAKKNNSTKIIAVPLDIVNMSEAEIIDTAIGRLHQQDKEAKYDCSASEEIKGFIQRYQQYLTEVFHEKRNKQKLQQGA